jgi:hypothetical protein
MLSIRLLSPALLVCLASVTSCPSVRAAESSAADHAAAITITAGPDWIPLRPELDIEPGSALDFSKMGFTDAPAGKHGQVLARADGQFAFSDSPDQPRRFYGVNLCFGAQYLSHEESDRLAERLTRLGYNAVRIHHYESILTQGQRPSTTLNTNRLDQLDYLTAALIRRGIYLTTDLFVSRTIPYREIGIERDGSVPMDTFKILVPVHTGAYANWKQFARNLLDHTNPYTGRRYAEEPALAWLSMINEGNYGNFFKDLRSIPEWTSAWNRWLLRQYPGRQALAKTWGQELKDAEDPSAANVALPDNLRGDSFRARDCVAFLSDTDHDMVQGMERFLHDDLGCRALVSNANSWTYFVTDQSARAIYDYVDDHFYVDHPQFLEQSWRLPSKCPNTSPIAEGATGGRSKSFTRLFDKPFTITEYNYSAPGRFRGVGGILTGAMSALQGWGGLWRFAYSHSRDAIFQPSHVGYFDVASDPLSQAAERASLCLFVRGDLKTAPHSVGIAMTSADLAHPARRIPTLQPKWHWMAWITRIGTDVIESPDRPLPMDVAFPLAWQTPAAAYHSSRVETLDPYTATDARLLEVLHTRQILQPDNPTDPVRKIFQSETREITIDGPRDVLVLDTPRTAGGYAPAGQSITTSKGGVRIQMEGSDATVWVSALDTLPIQQSHRLLVTQLTDLQNSEVRYRETARQTLLDWGRLPYLVRAGKATVSVQTEIAARCHVWTLSPSGKRLAEVPAQVESATLRFIADVAADPANGARMLYEIAE